MKKEHFKSISAVNVIILSSLLFLSTKCFSFFDIYYKNDVIAIVDRFPDDNEITVGASSYASSNPNDNRLRFTFSEHHLEEAIPNGVEIYFISASHFSFSIKKSTSWPMNQEDIENLQESDIIAKYVLSKDDVVKTLNGDVYFPPIPAMKDMTMEPSYDYLVNTYGKY